MLLDTLKRLLTALPSPAPQHCLIGGLAIAAWGQIRATEDIDLLVVLDDESLDALIQRLEPAGFHLDTRWLDANPFLKGVVTRLRHAECPIDLMRPRDAQEVEALGRRRLVTLGESNVWTCAPEDLILLKLKAGRPRDFEDAVSIVRYQSGALDLNYLWRWADRLGLQGELHYTLATQGS